MRYGYFDDGNKEYVITDPATPVPWINYIGDMGFGGFIDQTGGAQLCKDDPALGRITKYIPQLPGGMVKGETLYLRVRYPDGWKIISPYYTPCLDTPDEYECRIGCQYVTIRSVIHGIETAVTIFVPPGENKEVRSIKVRNTFNKRVLVEAFPFVEFSHFDALKQLTNADWVPQTMQTEFEGTVSGFHMVRQSAFMHRQTSVNYFAVSGELISYETDRERFLGNNGYADWSRPEAVTAGACSSRNSLRGNSIACVHVNLGNLEPGESKE
ncbi:MAG: glycosyl transferase, partial [Spirochaetia bacterium]